MDNKRLSLSIISCLIIGAVGAGLFAVRQQNLTTNTFQILAASMVRPVDAALSPRTYNQTLVETIDTTRWQSSLVSLGYPEPTSWRFDVLPDSFNIQITAGFDQPLAEEQKTTLAGELISLLQADSTLLAQALLDDATPTVVFSKTLGESAVIQQNPVAATIYGAIAGALFGLFLGLALTNTAQPKVLVGGPIVR